MREQPIEWTDYLRHRANTLGFDLAEIENIVRYAS